MSKTLKDFVNHALEKVKEISPNEAKDLIESGQYLLIDVREEDEFTAGHIPGAIHIPRGFLEVKADLEHPKRDKRLEDRSQRVICYCGGGFRSALAAEVLLDMGFENPLTMAEGWSGWMKSSLPFEK